MNKLFEIAEIEQSLEPVFHIYNVKKAVLFGSYAKGAATTKSDVDLYVDSGLKGMKFVGMVEDIRQALGGADVDVLDRTHLDDDAKVFNEIESSGVTVYER